MDKPQNSPVRAGVYTSIGLYATTGAVIPVDFGGGRCPLPAPSSWPGAGDELRDSR